MATDDYDTVRDTAEGNVEDLSSTQVLLALVLLRQLRDELDGWEPQLIEAARGLGTSWAELAPALGVASRQAAERRYLRVRRTDDEQGTRDQRVQAERDRRAGDRAVRDWARTNSAILRSLAGHVGQFDETVRLALGDDDAASLLDPLAAAHPQLRHANPDLAAQIADIAEQTERLRAHTLQQRINRSAADRSTIGGGEPEL